jgi:hypothetical protein
MWWPGGDVESPWTWPSINFFGGPVSEKNLFWHVDLAFLP